MGQTKTFADFNLQPYLLDAIKEINFHQPTPVQEKVIVLLDSQQLVVEKHMPFYCRSFLN